MISKDIVQLITCAIATDEHTVEKPIALSCSHHICTNCISTFKTEKVKCKICGQINKSDLKDIKESISANFLLKQNISSLFDDVKVKIDESVKYFQDMNIEVDHRLDLQIEFVKEEISVQIESIKEELNQLGISLRSNLDRAKEYFKQLQLEKSNEFYNNIYDVNTKIFCPNIDVNYEKYESYRFKILHQKLYHYSTICFKRHENERDIYYYQAKLRYIQKLIDDFKAYNPQIKLDISDKALTPDIVGKINSNYEYLLTNAKKLSHQNIVNRLKAEKYDLQTTKGLMYDMCTLSNDLLIVTFGNRLAILNNDFEIIKQTDKLNNKAFFSSSITIDNENYLYLVDCMNNRIIKTDLNFKIVSLIGAKNEFDKPCGICTQRNSIYVCDHGNKRIQKLTKTLDFESTLNVDFEPWFIKTNNYTICVTSTLFEIYFYDLQKFILKFKYDGHNGLIGRVNSNFYEYFALDKIIYCYDSDGKLIDEIKINIDLDIDGKYGGGIGYFKNRLILRSGFDKMVLV